MVVEFGKDADARSSSLILATFASAHFAPVRFTSPRCFSQLIEQTMTHPFARRLATGLLLRPIPHTMLSIVFVNVDCTLV
jgi:hypothetical protein